jgi:hypothetical protein
MNYLQSTLGLLNIPSWRLLVTWQIFGRDYGGISAVNLLNVLYVPICPDKLGTQVSLCSKCSKLGVIFSLDSTFVPWPRNSETG